jgi:hypothetical protein
VPYAIGTRVYYHGHVTDVSARFDRGFPGIRPGAEQLTAVVGGGGYAWAQLSGAAVDMAHVVGRIGPGGGWTGFHASAGGMSTVAVTTTGAVVMPESGQVFWPDGRLVASFRPRPAACGHCVPAAAGAQVVLQQYPDLPGPGLGTWLWAPPARPTRLPDDGYRALGRSGSGWLGAPAGSNCWRVAPVPDPTATRARFCSMTLPLVSPDGTRVIVVQAGRVRAVDTRTAADLGPAAIRPLTVWAPTGAGGAFRYLVPAAWESSDSYLVTARDDQVLALLRCSVRSGRCERAVRATVRAGVTGIVTERGPESIATA